MEGAVRRFMFMRDPQEWLPWVPKGHHLLLASSFASLIAVPTLLQSI